MKKSVISILLILACLLTLSCSDKNGEDGRTEGADSDITTTAGAKELPAYYSEPDIPKDTVLHSSLYGVDLSVYIPAVPYEALALDRAYIDAQIDNEVKLFLDNYGTVEEYSDESKAAENGDIALIMFEGRAHDPELELPADVLASMSNKGSGEGYALTLGSGTFIRAYNSEERPEKNNPGFEDQVVGHKKGDKFTVTVTFPDTYATELLRSAVIDFDVEILSLSHIAEDRITDALATKYTDFDSDEEFYTEIEKYYRRKCAYEGIKDQITIDDYPDDPTIDKEYMLVEYLFNDLKLSLTQGEYEEMVNEHYSINQEEYYYYYGIKNCSEFVQAMGKDSLIFYFEREMVKDKLAEMIEIIER